MTKTQLLEHAVRLESSLERVTNEREALRKRLDNALTWREYMEALPPGTLSRGDES